MEWSSPGIEIHTWNNPAGLNSPIHKKHRFSDSLVIQQGRKAPVQYVRLVYCYNCISCNSYDVSSMFTVVYNVKDNLLMF